MWCKDLGVFGLNGFEEDLFVLIWNVKVFVLIVIEWKIYNMFDFLLFYNLISRKVVLVILVIKMFLGVIIRNCCVLMRIYERRIVEGLWKEKKN